MRYIIVMVLLFICGTQAFSQRFEVGPFIGGANYIGDVGNTTYIQPKDLVVGGLVKWNQSPRHAFRFSLMHAQLTADDKRSHDTRRQERGYSFSNTVTEASLGIEYTFWEWDLSDATHQSTPYLYTGINYYLADHYREENGELLRAGNNWEFSIPMAFGYKESLTSFLTVGLELGARYTFTDNLDGSAPSEVDGNFRPQNFGNPNTTDWYVFTGIYLTFYFGRESCYTHL